MARSRGRQQRDFLSCVTVHEIEEGTGLLELRGAVTKPASLRHWLSGLVSTYDDKILPINTTVPTISGQLEAWHSPDGHNPGMADALITGTAKVHGLTVVTHNRKHFQPFGIHLPAPVAG